MAQDSRLVQRALEADRGIHKRRAACEEAPGDAEAARDAFLQRAPAAPSSLGAALAVADDALRARVVSRLQRDHGNAFVQRLVAQARGPAAVVQRAPTSSQKAHASREVSFEPEVVIKPHAGQTPSGIIGNYLKPMENAIGEYWQNYRSGIDNFQTTLSFETEESDGDHLATVFMGMLKAGIEGTFEAAMTVSEEINPYIAVVKGLADAIAEHFGENHPTGNVEIVKFITDARKPIGPAEADMRNDIAKMQDPLSTKYDDLAKQDAKAGGGTRGDPIFGQAGRLLNHIAQAGEKMQRFVRQHRSADYWQQQFTERFAHTGKTQVGLVAEGLHANGTLNLDVSVAQGHLDIADTTGADADPDPEGDSETAERGVPTINLGKGSPHTYRIKSADDAWVLMTNAPKYKEVAKSLEDSMAGQGIPPVDSALHKVVHVSVDTEDGHESTFTMTFQHLGEALGSARGHFPDHSSQSLEQIWEGGLRDKLKEVTKVEGSNG